MRLRRFLISEPMAVGTVPESRPFSQSARLRAGRPLSSERIGGGVTAAPGPLESLVEVRTLAPEPPTVLPAERSRVVADRDTSMSPVPTARRRRPRRRRGHADALGHAEGAAPAVRAPDGAARRRRARRAAARTHRHRRRPRRRTRHQDAPGAARHRSAGRVRRAARAARHRRRGERRAHRCSTTSTPKTTSSCCRATRRSCAPRRSRRLATEHRVQDAAATVLTAHVADPTGLGRVVRDKDDRVARIVEHADATTEEREIDEINTSIYCFRRNLLAPALRRLSPENAQGEYYLTDAIDVLRAAGHKVIAMHGRRSRRSDHGQRPRAARRRRGRAARAASTAAGCATASRWSTPRARTSTRPSSSSPTCGSCPARSSKAAPSIGAGSVIGPDCHLVDAVVGERVTRRERGRDATPRSATTATIGPFAYLRPGHPPRGRRQGRHVRRGEELRDRRGHEGAAPLLRRRRRHRRRRESRREHDHRQLRRRATSTAPRSVTACTRASTRRWSRRSSSATVRRPVRARS